MRNLMILAAVAACAVASPAMAQVTQGQYGDVQTVSGGYQLTSDTVAGPGYGGIYFGLGSGFTVGDLTTLSANYTMTDGSFGGGSPRFTLLGTSGGAAYIYFGTPNGDGTFSDPGTTTGNYVTSTDIRVECNGLAGCTTTYPGTTFADLVAQAGSTGISYVTLDVDGGFTGRQQLLVSEFNVNGNLYGATAAVPEPATWAMMLIGFGGIGFQMRRQRRKNAFLAQAA